MLFHTKIYTVAYVDNDQAKNSYNKVFYDRKTAEIDICNQIRMSYPMVKSKLEFKEFIDDDIYMVLLSEEYIEKPIIVDETEILEYEIKKSQILNLMNEKQQQKFKIYLKKVVDLNRSLRELDRFLQSNKLEEYTKEFTDYVTYIHRNEYDEEENEQEENDDEDNDEVVD